VTFFCAALAARQLDMSGALPVGLFVFLMTIAYGLLTLTTQAIFTASPWPGLAAIGSSVAHGFVNMLASSVVIRIVERILARYSDDEVGRRAPISFGLGRSGLA